MTNIQKLNKAFIAVIIITIFGYLLQVIDLSFFANDFTQIASQVQMVSAFIPAQDVQNINALLDFANNTAGVIRAILVTFAVLSAIASVVMLAITKVFANRLDKYKSVFTYCGLLIASSANVYLQFSIFPTFTGLISAIVIFASILIILISIGYIGVALFGLYKFVTSDDFNAAALGFDFAKVLSFIFIFIAGVHIALEISMYMSVSVLVQEIDLAAMIDVMNYIDIDWETILPPALFASGLLSADKIDFLINNVADQYLLSFGSKMIQDMILGISRTIIFDNVVAYVSAIVTGFGILYTVKKKFEYQNYVAIGLMALMIVIGFVYIGGLVANLLTIGFIACIILVALDIYKQYR